MSATVLIEEVTEPVEIGAARAQRKRFERNFAWLQAHGEEIYSQHRGKCVCIAGEEPFVANTPQQAVALAKAAHPEDDGSFVQYIPREHFARIYAHRR